MSTIYLAADLGGTLVKLGFFTQNSIPNKNMMFEQQFIFIDPQAEKEHTFRLTTFSNIQHFFSFLQQTIQYQNSVQLLISGGGALKYKKHFDKLKSSKFTYKTCLNQFQTILQTIKFISTGNISKIKINNQLFQTINQYGNDKEIIQKLEIPFILVNIGSGVSILKFQTNILHIITYQRVGGTALGGGFLTGLFKILQDSLTYQSIENTQTMQSSSNDSPKQEIIEEVCQNIAEIAWLYSEIHKINTIFFTGGLTKSEKIKQLLAEKMHKKTNIKTQKKRIYLSKLNGFLGVIGLLLQTQKLITKQVKQL